MKLIFSTFLGLLLFGLNLFGVNRSAQAAYSFNNNLRSGNVNSDVKELQKFLNVNGATVSKTGAGSFGRETNYFGPATKAAVVNF